MYRQVLYGFCVFSVIYSIFDYPFVVYPFVVYPFVVYPFVVYPFVVYPFVVVSACGGIRLWWYPLVVVSAIVEVSDGVSWMVYPLSIKI
jgi:hypothetical protein